MTFVEVRVVRRRLLSFALFVVPLALLLVSCSGGSSLSTNTTEAVRLQRSRALWARNGVRDYVYTVRVSAFVASANRLVRITVQNGRTVSITPDDGDPTPLENDGRFFARFATVESLFNVIQQALNARADSISVDYDSVLGYPTRINIDYIRLAVDDELGVQVSQFEATLLARSAAASQAPGGYHAP